MNLKQLSDQLGLSQTTVSRALNGYPEVSEATRQRVMDAARAANYTPSTRARSLATGRAMAIGHVIPVSHKHEMVNPVFGDFVAGAGEIYAEAGYEMLISHVRDDTEERVYRMLKAKGSVDGIVVHGPRMADARLALLTDLDLPFVVHGRASDVNVPYPWVDVPNTSAFRDATRHLLELGHRRVALINGPEGMDFAFRRRAGYAAALREAGLAPEPRWMRSAEMTEAYGYDSAREILAMRPAPTAFLSASLITALGIQRAVSEAGLTLGRDVSLVTFDDELSYLRNGSDTHPILTAMRSSVRQAGREAARMLLARIAAPHAAPMGHMMPCTLVVGPSSGPAPT